MQTPENTILFRISAIEQDIAGLKQQLDRYVPVRENELQLKSIRDTVERIERDVQTTKQQIEQMNTRFVASESESERRDAAQRESQAALQIKVLWGIVSSVIAILTAILIGYVTHFFR